MGNRWNHKQQPPVMAVGLAASRERQAIPRGQGPGISISKEREGVSALALAWQQESWLSYY